MTSRYTRGRGVVQRMRVSYEKDARLERKYLGIV